MPKIIFWQNRRILRVTAQFVYNNLKDFCSFIATNYKNMLKPLKRIVIYFNPSTSCMSKNPFGAFLSHVAARIAPSANVILDVAL